MRILGIDPGFERLGIAILEKSDANQKNGLALKDKEAVLYSECFKTSAKLEFANRLGLIGKKIKDVIKKFQPDALAIETLFLNTNQKTAMRVAEARGVVIYEALSSEIKIYEISPLQVKMAVTGYGRASKEELAKMVKILIKIDDLKKSDDEMDAIAVALTASAQMKI